MRLGKAALLLDDWPPGFQEVSTEGDDVAGLGEVVERQFIEPEDAQAGRALGGAVEGLVAHQPAAECFRPIGEEVVERAGPGAADDRELAARTLELLCQARDGFVPEERLEGATLFLERSLGSAGIVEALQPGLAALTERTCVDGVRRIAFQFDGARLARLDVEAAAGGALRAGAGVPGGDSGHLVFALDQVGNQLFNVPR